MDPRIVALYEDYVHVHSSRRLFLERAAKLAGSVAAAAAMLELLKPNYALAAIIAPDDARLTIEHVTYPGFTGPVKAYLARPKGNGKHPGIIVCHQQHGLNPHIEDIARRLAVQGYAALAIDFLSPVGGTPPDDDLTMKLNAALDKDKVTWDAKAGVAWIRTQPFVGKKVGAIGFCYGGEIVNKLAVSDPTLDAGVVYYGIPPDPSLVPQIKAPLILNYADRQLDKMNGDKLPGYEAALKAAGVKFEFYVYDGAYHGFNDDAGEAGPRYNETLAKLAWERSMKFLKKNLG